MIRGTQLVVDARQLQATGIGTHLRQGLAGLAERAADRMTVIMGADDAGLEPEGVHRTFSRVQNPYLPPIDARRRLAGEPVGTWWTPHYAAYPVPASRLVVTVHDLIHLDDPSGSLPGWKRWYARRQLARLPGLADTVVCPSQRTAARLAEVEPALATRTRVIWNAVEETWRTPAPVPHADRARRVVYVGTTIPHKDVPTLLAAAARVAEAGTTDLEYVLLTPRPWRDDRLPAAAERARSAGASVRFIDGPVPTAEVVELVARALVIVHPSLEEGFGLPLAEAMTVGTPSIASRIPTHVEVGGDHVQWFTAGDGEELANRILALVGDQGTWQAAADTAHRGASRFDLSVMQAELADVLLEA